MIYIEKRNATELPCILFLDDEERILRAVRALFRGKYEVLTTTDSRIAIEHLKHRRVHVVVSDYRMPDTSGVDFLREAKLVSPHTIRLMLTGYADLDVTVGSINDGEVFQFISKPWDQDILERVIAEAAEASARSTNVNTPFKNIKSSDIYDKHMSILAVSRSKRFYDAVADLEKDVCEVKYAETIDEANLALRTHQVAVVVAEDNLSRDDVALFLMGIKRERPDILTILVTPAVDAEKTIDLINQAQLFRLLTMPVSTTQLKSSIESALRHILSVARRRLEPKTMLRTE